MSLIYFVQYTRNFVQCTEYKIKTTTISTADKQCHLCRYRCKIIIVRTIHPWILRWYRIIVIVLVIAAKNYWWWFQFNIIYNVRILKYLLRRTCDFKHYKTKIHCKRINEKHGRIEECRGIWRVEGTSFSLHNNIIFKKYRHFFITCAGFWFWLKSP